MSCRLDSPQLLSWDIHDVHSRLAIPKYWLLGVNWSGVFSTMALGILARTVAPIPGHSFYSVLLTNSGYRWNTLGSHSNCRAAAGGECLQHRGTAVVVGKGSSAEDKATFPGGERDGAEGATGRCLSEDVTLAARPPLSPSCASSSENLRPDPAPIDGAS